MNLYPYPDIEPRRPNSSHNVENFGSVLTYPIRIPPARKQRRLDFVKCRYCRQSKQKVNNLLRLLNETKLPLVPTFESSMAWTEMREMYGKEPFLFRARKF
jgi:hypothetical protein